MGIKLTETKTLAMKGIWFLISIRAPRNAGRGKRRIERRDQDKVHPRDYKV